MINKKILFSGAALLGGIGVGTIERSPILAYTAEIEKSYFKDSLKQAVDKNYLTEKQLGVTTQEITRAEFAAVIYNAMTKTTSSQTIDFKDVPKNHLYYKEITEATKLGLIVGYQDDTFKPDAKISREEMAILVLRFLEKEGYSFATSTSKSSFKDAGKAKYPYVLQKLRDSGIVAGYEDNSYKPLNKISKEEALALVLRADNLVEYEQTNFTKTGVVTGDINVRYAPSFSSTSFGVLNTGATVGIEKMNDVWYKVKHNGKVGYVYGIYIQEIKSDNIGLAYANQLVNIYGENDVAITYVATGTELYVSGVNEKEGKVFIKIGELEGYVKSHEVFLVSNQVNSERSYYSINSNNEVTNNIYNFKTGKYSSFVIGKNNSTLGLVNGKRYYSSNNANINGNKEVYPYYNYLPLRTKSNITGAQIDAYIKANSPSSPLIGLGQAFVDAAKKYELNAMYLVANALHESAYGMSDIAKDKKNLFGFKAYDSSAYDSAAEFATLEDGIYYCAEFISTNYLNPASWRYHGAVTGDKSLGMNVKYASDISWGAKIASHMYRMDKFIGFKDYNNYVYGEIKKSTPLYDANGALIKNLEKDRIVATVKEVVINNQAHYEIIADENDIKRFYILKSKFKKFQTF